MNWLQISITATAAQAEDIENTLMAQGALSVTVVDAADQPLLEPGPGETPIWDRTRITGLFSDDENIALLRDRLLHALGEDIAHEISIEKLEDREWTRAWMEHFKPMCFGKRMWVVPEGFSPPDPDATNMRLDPGLAFGTGTHPTTALCLEWLDACELTGKTVIDYGCGSGILAIAALLLGAIQAWAVDNDPQALVATRENARKNAVDKHIDTLFPAELPAIQADICMANILAGPLLELAPILADHTRPGGKIILSGILADQADQVRARYSEWFDMPEPTLRSEWARLEGTRK